MSESLSKPQVDHAEQGLVVGHRSNGRNIYSKQGKLRLVEICLRPGISLARVALQNGLNANLLHRWVREYLDGQRSVHAGTSVAGQFLPVLPMSKSARPATADSVIEIDVAGATIRLRGPVDPAQLRQVLDCLTHS